MKPSNRSWRLNIRAVVLLAAGVLIALVVPFALAALRGNATLLDQAQSLAKAGKPDLALRYVNQYLDQSPDDPRALDLKAGLLADSAYAPEHIQEAIRACELALRHAPDSSQSETRRRLLELHLKLGDVFPDLVPYRAVEELAKTLVEQSPDDAGALRLLARVEASLAAKEGDAKALNDATANFEKAGRLDPKDVDGAERLALLYRDRANQPDKAVRVLDQLIAADPSSSRAYLVRYRFFTTTDSGLTSETSTGTVDRKATAALQEALRLAPKNFEVLIAAAENAQRQGQVAEARRHLDGIAESQQSDSRVLFLRGMIALHENQVEPALEFWRQGLLASGGNDAGLAWRMAFVLLQMGRVDDAKPLMDQFRRLSGGKEPAPSWRFLHALTLLKQNHPANAIQELETVRKKGGALLAGQVAHALGQAHEAIRDEPGALEEYRRAVKAAPRWVPPRLALVRLLQVRQPEQADAELNRALAEVPNDPGLLIFKARQELGRQITQARQNQRKPASWGTLETLITQIGAAVPTSPALALIEADYRSATGQPDQAIARLEEATRHTKQDADLWLARATKLAEQGRTPEALLVLEQAAAPEAAGDQVQLRILRARLLARQGHGKEAREGLLRNLDQLPPDQRPLAWMELGNQYAAQRNLVEARKAYEAWAKLLPDDPIPRLHLLELAMASGDEDAIHAEIEALKGSDDAANLYYRIATVTELLSVRKGITEVQKTARLERARELIETIRADAPDQRYAYVLEGQYWEQRDNVAKAIDAYERSLEHEGGPTALQRLVVLYTKKNRYQDIKRLGREHSESAPGLDRLAAEIAVQLGDKDRAAQLAELVAQSDPQDLNTTIWLAKVLNTVGRPEDADKALRALAEAHPDEVGPWTALLYFQAGQKQTAEAQRTADRMRASLTKIEHPEFRHAQWYRVAGDLARAAALYDEALTKWPHDSNVVRGAAEFYEATGRADKAQTCLTAVVQHDPSQRWAARQLALVLSAHGQGTSAWSRAWDYLGAPSATDTPEDRLTRAIVLSRGPEPSQHREAIETLEQLVNDLPAGLSVAATARATLIRLYVQDKEPEKAVALLETDAKLANATAATVAAYAEALLLVKQWDQAETQIDRLASLTPEDLAAPRLRALRHQALGETAKIAEPLEQFYQGRRDAPGAETIGRDVVLLLIQLDQLDAAERIARNLAEKWPAQSGVLAALLTRNGHQTEAMDLYRTAAKVGDAAIRREAVQNAMSLATTRDLDPNRLDAADAVIEAARQHEPKAVDLIIRQAYLRHYQQRFEDEVHLYHEALSNNPTDFSFLNNMAWSLCEGLNDPKTALERINEAFRRTGAEYPQFFDTRGVIYTRLKQYPEAIQDLETSVRNRPSGVVYAHLARAYHEAGDLAKFQATRDLAKQAKLTLNQLEPSEQVELKALLFPDS